jgi:peptidoglycan hydrolase-like protein with peptidoglycan-binding domain/GH25 family lysozyme M1 (1,4-beta-N-acetylmuramidase)
MLQTIRHQDTGKLVVVAKCLTGYIKTSDKISDAESYIKVNGVYDAEFVAYVVSWQTSHGCTPNGIIGPAEWTAIAKAAPTCSTAKNRKSGYTFALQLLLDGNITADAIYGPRTKAAVAAYQSATGLSTDGICGPKTWNGFIVGSEAPAPSKFVQPKDFKQGAKPWGPKMYSSVNNPNQTMANSGCGPTAVSDVVYTLRDNSIDPYVIAMQAVKWGDRSKNGGTDWTLMKPHVPDYYDFPKCIQTKTMATMKACLDAGGYVVCSMRKGYWTTGGHFITAWKYDDTDIYANDPASSKRTHQEANQFHSECKQYFCYYPESSVKPAPEPDPEPTPVVNRGSKIVDISKYQPTVNYDKLIGDTALIILRAGYRGTAGGISEDQKFQLHASELRKRGVRFGVYFYSIATNEDKAREEARMFYSYAKDYNPLFWAMDAEKDAITTGAIVAFIDELRKLGAKKVGCYVANHLYNKYDYSSIADHMDFTWIPRYGSTKPVHKCDLWQFTSTGSANGINGNVDMSRITGEGHDIAWFTEG